MLTGTLQLPASSSARTLTVCTPGVSPAPMVAVEEVLPIDMAVPLPWPGSLSTKYSAAATPLRLSLTFALSVVVSPAVIVEWPKLTFDTEGGVSSIEILTLPVAQLPFDVAGLA